MASLRGDRYDNKGVTLNDKRSGSYTQNALSPKLGIVYQPVKEKVSLFANYMNGFANQGGADFNGNNFKPQQGNQWEAGVKLDIWHHRLNATLSYYHIAVNNVLRTDTAHAGFSVQDGTQRSRGFEAEIVANPFAGFNLLAGYGYNDNRYTRSNAAVQGKRPLGTPEHMANFWISYKRPSGVLKGWGLGFGGNYASQSFFNDANTFIIPASAILSATLFYEQPKWRLGVKVNNLGNQHYWSYIGAPQNPRQLVANIAYKF
jgi:iron complex outermembrane receptor protein